MSLSDIQSMKALKIAKQNANYIGNLFNKGTVNNGYSLNGGTLFANPTYCTTDYIPVVPTSQYMATDVRFIEFYDQNKVYISNSLVSYNPSRQNIMFRASFSSYFVRITSTPINMLQSNYWVLPIRNPSKWVSKIWSAMGDSITQGNFWEPYVNDQLGFSYFNYGVGGTKIADLTGTDTTAMCRDERINALNANSNLITVMGGTNDWGNNVPLGNTSDTVTNTFYGALNTMIKKIVTRFPTQRLVLMTPPYGKQPNRSGWTDAYGLKNNLNLTSLDYGNAMMTIARIWGIPCVDIGGKAGWNDVNITTYCSIESDGVTTIHPNDAGGRRIAEVLIGDLKKLEPTV